MRELKFRAWDKKEKEFRYIEMQCKTYHCGYFIEHDGMREYSEFEWNQYTGLLDKNLKEIHEGDIVIYKHYSKNCHITFEFGSFIIRRRMRIVMLIGEEEKNIEVIGNIYENPELLED